MASKKDAFSLALPVSPLARSFWSPMRRQPLIQTHSERPSVGLAAAKYLYGTAYLKPEPSISTLDSILLVFTTAIIPLDRVVLAEIRPNILRKRPRTTAPTGLLAASGQEREIRDINQDIVNSGSTDDSDDEDYTNMSDTTSSKRGGRPQSRKRARRTEDREHNDMEAPTHPLDISYQAIVVTSSTRT
ncbi:hypothetical protein BJ875DRAFT_490305 [Amylocarpus encephaloides]|uniref:Uncharacterized protein n=1 Tax=Amylocarpus encephaloides TaxID=45428 RepID=A0A9P8C0D2_9HELO|nr:hypothetical protein BJ875DRAFT_490305 [Amylocarpus encephaloides]